MNMQKQAGFVIATSIVLCTVCSVYALYTVSDKGMWPKSWPEELEPLRKQSRTLKGSMSNLAIHVIPFANREDFESAWPHILKLKSNGAPVILLRGPDTRLGTIDAGVRIRSPQTGNLVTHSGQLYPASLEASVPGGQFLRIGPPWPDYIMSESGALPKVVFNDNGKWSPWDRTKGFKGIGHLIWARTDIELVVDGDIVDLNRISLPADTPIIDKRFTDGNKK